MNSKRKRRGRRRRSTRPAIGKKRKKRSTE